MGYITHDAVIVTVNDYVWNSKVFDVEPPDVDAFRESMPDEFRQLIVGPIHSLTNGYVTFLFAPHGSKEGWGIDEKVEEWRDAFIDLFSFTYGDGSSPYDVVHVRYGADYGRENGTTIAYASQSGDTEKTEGQ